MDSGNFNRYGMGCFCCCWVSLAINYTNFMTLSNKQKAFIEEYLHDFNATQAAIRAGYSEKTAYSIGHENLRKPEISEVIEKRLQEVHMSADEALGLLADIARGDLGDFINDFGMVDTSLARDEGKTKLIKKLQTKTVVINGKQEDKEIHTQTIELYPADAAIRDVLKIHGKFIDRQDITSGGEKIESVTDERFDRAISSLADALREIIPGQDAKKTSEMAPTE